MNIEVDEIEYDEIERVIKIRMPEGSGYLDTPLQKILDLKNYGKRIAVSLKEAKRRRSMDANSLFWKITHELSVVLGKSTQEVYVDLLRKYGYFDYFAVLEKALPTIKSVYRIVDELGEVSTESGVPLIRIRAYRGISTYNTKEFSHLIDRAIEEAKENGLDILTGDEMQEIRNKLRKQMLREKSTL